jgi:hypothetical protein
MPDLVAKQRSSSRTELAGGAGMSLFSTMDRHAGILVHVHPGLRLRVGRLRNPSLAAHPRMNNLPSFDSWGGWPKSYD